MKNQSLGHRATRLFTTPPPESQKPSTKTLLIDAAEMLFGRHGFDAVSLREIATMAGQANKSVTQYHFKDKAGLVIAILKDRIQRMEAVRSEYLQNLNESDPNYSRELIKATFLPTTAIRNSDGEHTFCRFVLQLLLQPNAAENPLSKLYRPAEDGYVDERIPIHAKVVSLFLEQYKDIPRSVLLNRMRALNKMFLTAVVEHDNARLDDRKRDPSEFNCDPILDMCVVAITAPQTS